MNNPLKIRGDTATHIRYPNITLTQSKRVADSLAQRPNTIFSNSNPTLITDHHANPTIPNFPTLPNPIKNNYKILEPPTPLHGLHHCGHGEDCFCTVETLSFHRPAVLIDHCMKNTFTASENYRITTKQPISLFENLNRHYTFNNTYGTHILQNPQHFLTSARQVTSPYTPAYALTNSEDKNLYYHLLKPEGYMRIASTYIKPADTWTEAEHPFFSEPKAPSELFYRANGAPSSETLFRTNFATHPCNQDTIPLYSTTNQKTLEHDILLMGAKWSVDNYLSAYLHPFITKGHGKILCPQCIVTQEIGIYTATFYSRNQFILHYRTHHYDHFPFMALYSASGYHHRQYEAHLIYHMLLPFKNSADYPSLAPTLPERPANFHTRISNSIARFMNIHTAQNGAATPTTVHTDNADTIQVPDDVSVTDTTQPIEPQPIIYRLEDDLHLSNSEVKPEGYDPSLPPSNIITNSTSTTADPSTRAITPTKSRPDKIEDTPITDLLFSPDRTTSPPSSPPPTPSSKPTNSKKKRNNKK